MSTPSPHVVPLKTINGTSLVGYGDIQIDSTPSTRGVQIDDSAGIGETAKTWSADKISGQLATHTHSGYAAAAHTHSGYASSAHNHDSDYAAASHTHAEFAAENHTHPLATGVADGLMSSADKTKLDGLTTAGAYTHPTSDGNLHVPATGTDSNGKVLTAGSTAGSLSWTTLSASSVGAAPATHTHAEYAAAAHTHSGYATDTHTHSDYVTATETKTLTNKTLEAVNLTKGYTESVFEVTGATPALSPANGSIQTWALTANEAPTIGAWDDGQSILLGVTAGSYTVTWPTVKWSKVGGSGTAPSLTATGINWVVLWKVGGSIFGSFLGTA